MNSSTEIAATASESSVGHLEIRGISKNFGAVQALKNVDLTAYRSEVLGLVGDNGAGKSTLLKIIAGVETADTGRILIDQREVSIKSPQSAAEAGIQTVFQDLALCENLDVTANLFLGNEEVTSGWARFLPWIISPLRSLDMEKQARQAIAKLNVRTLKSVRAKVGLLSGGQRQAVAIARAIRTKSSVVLLDEPTAALGVAQTAQVLDIVRQLRINNHTVIYISHNLRDVFAVCDRIAVLRHGSFVGVWKTAETNPDEIVVAIAHGTD